jgi:lysyl-tRNA synthetase class 2
LLRELREFFHARGFVEVETPLLSADVVVDRHLDPLTTILAGDPRRPSEGRCLFLQTSPEFGMKRLLAAGAPAIFQVTRAFRNAEVGPLHNPEFTLVEWYRPGDDLAAGVQLLSDLCQALLNRGPAETISYAEAFTRHAGINPLLSTAPALAAAAADRGVSLPAGLNPADVDLWLDLLLVELVQPRLGRGRPTILVDFPPSQAALARIRVEPEKPPVAERFELFVDGIELANGYHELLDPSELRLRIRRANKERAADGKPPLPETNRLLEAMEHGLPPCCGCALGFDRLALVALGATTLAEVLAFPIDRA